MTRRFATVLAPVVALIVATGCGFSDHATGTPGGSTSAGSPASSGSALTDVTSIDQLRGAFNANPDQPRLILLAAPT